MNRIDKHNDHNDAVPADETAQTSRSRTTSLAVGRAAAGAGAAHERLAKRPSPALLLQGSMAISAADVLCGRGKASFHHAGNERFRNSIASNLPSYREATRLFDKALIVDSISREIRQAGGRFLKYDNATGLALHELSDQQVKEKVGRALRDAVAASSGASWRTRRRSEPAPSSPTMRTVVPMRGSEPASYEPIHPVGSPSLSPFHSSAVAHEPHPDPSQELAPGNLGIVRVDEWTMDDPEEGSQGGGGDAAAGASDGHEQFLEAIDSVLGRDPVEEYHDETNLSLGDDAEGADPFNQSCS